MSLSQKCQYALRAILELARRSAGTPVTVAEIAQAQEIPQRFLEAILVQLKRGGFVESRRGMKGGYLLAVSPAELKVGQVIGCIDGPIAAIKSAPGGYPHGSAPAFEELWEQARTAVETVYNSTTFQNLLDKEEQAAKTYMGSNI